MAIFRPKPTQIFFFGLVPKSPIHIGLIYVKNPKPNISCLGPFKKMKLFLLPLLGSTPHPPIANKYEAATKEEKDQEIGMCASHYGCIS
jgi:hypothetical protein